MTTIRTSLDMVPGYIPARIHLSQSDKTSRTLQFYLHSRGQTYEIPSGSSVAFNGRKPDGTAFSFPMTIIDSSNVEIDVEQQMTTSAGSVECEISISDGTDMIGSANFILMVEAAPLGSAVMSESDYQLFVNAVKASANIGSVSDIENEVNTAVARIDAFVNSRGGTASETVLWNGWANYLNQEITLSESPDDFDWIEIHYQNGRTIEIKKVPTDEFIAYRGITVTSSTTLDGEHANAYIAQLNLRPVDSSTTSDHTVYKVFEANEWQWDGESTSSATIEQATLVGDYSAGVIRKITGIKYVPDTEVTDARVGYDGTTYTNLGTAIREQISALQTAVGISLTEESTTRAVTLTKGHNEYTLAAQDYVEAEVNSLQTEIAELKSAIRALNQQILDLRTLRKTVYDV